MLNLNELVKYNIDIDEELGDHQRRYQLLDNSSVIKQLREPEHYRVCIRTNHNVNAHSVEIVDISNSQNPCESIGNDSHLSNRRSRSRSRQTSE